MAQERLVQAFQARSLRLGLVGLPTDRQHQTLDSSGLKPSRTNARLVVLARERRADS